MSSEVKKWREETHEVDFCVVGGGLAGLCAALAAARHGMKVALMHDRPVLGGNSSSECRVHVSGADRSNGIPNLRETGILEELRLENLYRNSNQIYSIWDTVLYEKARYEPNLTLLLNCSCLDTQMAGKHLVSIRGWQLTTYTYHTVKAKLFADCSGDAILAPLTGADSRMGREARAEYGESIAPEQSDELTMGMTCLFQSREHDEPQPFEPPRWANRYDSCDELPYGAAGHKWWTMGYWWIELGGEHHGIYDTERLRDELLKITYGVWDHIKNRCPNREAAACHALDWVQFLPGKRESRRYVGEHVLSQPDVEAEGRFDDLVAYGGWTMDDHHPAGFNAVKLGAPATIFHPAPSPFGIPYRSLYSRNIENLMFAGRDASCTHAAMSSTRVMGTASSMGQAMGTAAALAVKHSLYSPKEVGRHITELQQTLLADDAYLPWTPRELPDLASQARLSASQGDPEPVRDGVSRPVGANQHCWTARPGDSLSYQFEGKRQVEQVSLVLDSALEKDIQLSYHHRRKDQVVSVPVAMARTFRFEGLSNGDWQTIAKVENNYQRLVRLPVAKELEGIRFVLDETWGSESSRIFAFNIA